MLIRHLLLMILAMSINVSVNAQEIGDYQLGANDVVKITVFQHDELTSEARVSEMGMVSLPLIGDVKVVGLTAKQAQEQIESLYTQRQIVRSPQVTVFVKEFNSNMVSVLGNVQKPGQYPLMGRMNVLEILAKAGGITDEGGDEVVITTTNKDGAVSSRNIDLSKMLKQGVGQNDLFLTGNDVVYVPESEMFYIYGEVRKPGAYKIKKGMTVMQAISLGGGLTERGTTRRVKVSRLLEDGSKDKFSIDLDDVIQADDVLRIKEGLF